MSTNTLYWTDIPVTNLEGTAGTPKYLEDNAAGEATAGQNVCHLDQLREVLRLQGRVGSTSSAVSPGVQNTGMKAGAPTG